LGASVRFAETLSIILVTFSNTIQGTLSEAVTIDTSSVQVIMKGLALVTVLTHYIVFAVTLTCGESKADTGHNIDNTACITTALLTVGEVEGVSDTLVTLASTNVVQAQTLTADRVARGPLGTEHVASAFQAVGVSIVTDGAFVAVVTMVVWFAIATTGSRIAFAAGAARLGTLAFLADGEAEVAGFAVITAPSSVFLSTEAFSSDNITNVIGGTSITAWTSLTEWIVEVARGTLFAFRTGKSFDAWAGTGVWVANVRGNSLSAAFTNSAVGEIEESGSTLIAVLASKVVFARAGITKWQADFVQCSVVVAIARSAFGEVVVTGSTAITTISCVLRLAVTSSSVWFTCAQCKLAVAIARNASFSFALLHRSPVPVGAQFAVDAGGVVLAVLTDAATLVVAGQIQGQATAGNVLVVHALGGVAEAVAGFTFVERFRDGGFP
jgi:hypothetical protein